MLRPYLLLQVLLWLFVSGCSLFDLGSNQEREEGLPFEQIALLGVDRLSIGSTFQVVVRTQEEYEELVYERYQKPLSEYCNEHYADVRKRLERENSGSSEAEIQKWLNEVCIEETPVFQELEGVEHPTIDFSEHALLGQSARTGSCPDPSYDLTLAKIEATYRYQVLVTRYGTCERAYHKNLWILTPPIPESSDVVFEQEVQTAK